MLSAPPKAAIRPGERASSPVTVANTAGEWAAAVFFCYLCFQAMWTYHDLWRAKPYSLSTANEALGLAGTCALSLALALGPLFRLTGKHRGALRLRRPLGLAGVVCALAHGALHFAAQRLSLNTPGGVAGLVLGIAATLLYLAMAATSWPSSLRRLGAARWKRVQRLGPWLLVLTVAHYVVQGKILDWVGWFQSFGQPKHVPAPGGTLPMSVVALAVLALRAVEARRAKG